jgi:two-component system chemotaxis response regulator CheY
MNNILIVDDSKTIRASVRFMLPKEEFELFEAQDGKDALEVLSSLNSKGTKIDMIVTDYNMPNMGGIDFIKALKNKNEFKEIPVLVATTESETEKRMEGKNVGAVGWMVKPYNPDQFLTIVRRFCQG